MYNYSWIIFARATRRDLQKFRQRSQRSGNSQRNSSENAESGDPQPKPKIERVSNSPRNYIPDGLQTQDQWLSRRKIPGQSNEQRVNVITMRWAKLGVLGTHSSASGLLACSRSTSVN